MTELHVDVWRGVEDKSVMSGLAAKMRVGLKLLFGYPWLALRYLFAGRHDVVVIGYMGLFDMLLLAPLAKLRGKPVVWDVFLSIYDTVVRDRGMDAEHGWKGRLLRWMERRACRTADILVMDTKAHAALLAELHGVPDSKLDAVLVGAEEGAFPSQEAASPAAAGEPLQVLFYGQFIPLHGIDTIIDAALDPRGRNYRWIIIGQGQEAERIDARLESADAAQIHRISWVDYQQLAAQMAGADICLGIFGTSDKASRVIPNKVFQSLAVGKPLITRDSGAMRELVSHADEGIYLVPPSHPEALLDALETFASERASLPPVLHGKLQQSFSQAAIADGWRRILERARAA